MKTKVGTYHLQQTAASSWQEGSPKMAANSLGPRCPLLQGALYEPNCQFWCLCAWVFSFKGSA
jgi:hypothetical protein